MIIPVGLREIGPEDKILKSRLAHLNFDAVKRLLKEI